MSNIFYIEIAVDFKLSLTYYIGKRIADTNWIRSWE